MVTMDTASQDIVSSRCRSMDSAVTVSAARVILPADEQF